MSINNQAIADRISSIEASIIYAGLKDAILTQEIQSIYSAVRKLEERVDNLERKNNETQSWGNFLFEIGTNFLLNQAVKLLVTEVAPFIFKKIAEDIKGNAGNKTSLINGLAKYDPNSEVFTTSETTTILQHKFEFRKESLSFSGFHSESVEYVSTGKILIESISSQAGNLINNEPPVGKLKEIGTEFISTAFEKSIKKAIDESVHISSQAYASLSQQIQSKSIEIETFFNEVVKDQIGTMFLSLKSQVKSSTDRFWLQIMDTVTSFLWTSTNLASEISKTKKYFLNYISDYCKGALFVGDIIENKKLELTYLPSYLALPHETTYKNSIKDYGTMLVDTFKVLSKSDWDSIIKLFDKQNERMTEFLLSISINKEKLSVTFEIKLSYRHFKYKGNYVAALWREISFTKIPILEPSYPFVDNSTIPPDSVWHNSIIPICKIQNEMILNVANGKAKVIDYNTLIENKKIHEIIKI